MQTTALYAHAVCETVSEHMNALLIELVTIFVALLALNS